MRKARRLANMPIRQPKTAIDSVYRDFANSLARLVENVIKELLLLKVHGNLSKNNNGNPTESYQ